MEASRSFRARKTLPKPPPPPPHSGGELSVEMGGASKFSVLLSTRLSLHPRSLLRLSRESQLPPASISAVIGAGHRLPFSGLQPRRGCFSGAEAQLHTPGRAMIGCEEALITPPYHRASVLPWPEWLKLVEYLTACGYTGRQVPPARGEDDDFSLASEEMPEDFRNVVGACLYYAREWPDLLRYGWKPMLKLFFPTWRVFDCLVAYFLKLPLSTVISIYITKYKAYLIWTFSSYFSG